MLPTTMVTLRVSSTDNFDMIVWIQDLNIPDNEKGARLKQGKTLSVQLQEDANGNVYYHWAAEQLVEGPAFHSTGVVQPPDPAAVVAAGAVRPLSISLTANNTVLPYMFRPYP